jgi:hypothetical protein
VEITVGIVLLFAIGFGSELNDHIKTIGGGHRIIARFRVLDGKAQEFSRALLISSWLPGSMRPS